uniref:DNA-directed DNA polymerase n=1 Tax=Liriope tetraphylla TaxID=37524 RepID=A0A0S2IB23_9CNID|nr:putative family B DNA polymerase [Liriope tetraphylla]
MYTPLNLIILDIETLINKNKHYILKIGILIKNSSEQIYKMYTPSSDPRLIIDSLFNDVVKFSNNKEKIFIYCHNLSKFDGPLLIQFFLNNRRIRTERIIRTRNGLIYIQIRTQNRIIILKDSLRLIPKSLKKLSLLFSTPGKTHLPFNPRAVTKPPKSINSYLRSDLKIVSVVLRKLNFLVTKNFDLNIYTQLSLPSLGLSLLQKINPEKFLITPGETTKKFIRKSYKGGILFCKVGKSTAPNLYDINSLYAFSMLNKQPIGKPHITKSKDINNIFGFVQLKSIKFPNNIPFVNKFRSYYFSEELRFLKNLGVTFEIKKSYQFKSSYRPFNKFSNVIYSNKENNTNIGEAIGKAILNSTYGKLGVNEPQIEDQTHEQLNNIYKMYTPLFSKSNKRFFNLKPNSNSVAIASAISSYSRLSMLQRIFDKNLKIDYVNTDSLIVTNTSTDLPLNGKIGSFKRMTPKSFKEGLYLNLKSFILSKERIESPQVKGAKFGTIEKLEMVPESSPQIFYEPRWNWKQADLFTQTRKIRFGLGYNLKGLIKEGSNL